VRRRDEIIRSLSDGFRANNAPVGLIVFGSTAYLKDHPSTTCDIDMFLAVPEAVIEAYSAEELNQMLLLEGTPLAPSEDQLSLLKTSSDTETHDHLKRRPVDAFRTDMEINGVHTSLIWTPSESLQEGINPIGIHDRTQYNVLNYVSTRNTDKVTTPRGDIVYTPKRVLPVPGKDWTERIFPGKRWLKTDEGDNFNYIPTLPFILEHFLLCEIPYDGTGEKLEHTVVEAAWRSVVRGILYYNNLYDDYGVPREEAYDPNYIYNIFIRREWFDNYAKQTLQNRYEYELNRIKAVSLRNQLVAV
jgi:hypothetical protein